MFDQTQTTILRKIMTVRHRPATAMLTVAGILAAPLTACGTSPDDEGSTTDRVVHDETAAALQEGGELLVWAWEPTLDQGWIPSEATPT